MGEVTEKLSTCERARLRYYTGLLSVHLGLNPDDVDKMKPDEREEAFRNAIRGIGGKRTVAEQLVAAPAAAVKLGGRDVALRPLPYKAAFEWRRSMAAKMDELAKFRQSFTTGDDNATAKDGCDYVNKQDEATAELLEAYLQAMGEGPLPEAATMDEINSAWEVAAGLACPFLKRLSEAAQGQIRTGQAES